MNSSFMGDLSRESIGGIVRDSKGKVLIQFCKEVRGDSTVHAEVVASREGLLVAVASH